MRDQKTKVEIGFSWYGIKNKLCNMKNNYFFAILLYSMKKNHGSYTQSMQTLSLRCLVIQMKLSFMTEMKQKVSVAKLSWQLSFNIKKERNSSKPNLIQGIWYCWICGSYDDDTKCTWNISSTLPPRFHIVLWKYN